ncbi:unnamed protein product [Diplocarpon coronariae]|nr:hypothetical protein JHW43_009294 [Diplocarpon mali]
MAVTTSAKVAMAKGRAEKAKSKAAKKEAARARAAVAREARTGKKAGALKSTPKNTTKSVPHQHEANHTVQALSPRSSSHHLDRAAARTPPSPQSLANRLTPYPLDLLPP